MENYTNIYLFKNYTNVFEYLIICHTLVQSKMINHSSWVSHTICSGACIKWKEINVQLKSMLLFVHKPLQPCLSS